MTRGFFRGQVASLSPSAFALVMATGIVSIASQLLSFRLVARVLLWINVLFFIIQLVALISRLILFPAAAFKDLATHAKGAGYLTVTAATSVLGTQLFLLYRLEQVALCFWWAALVSWALILYSFFILVTLSPRKPSLEDGMNGGWLLLTVATQSICVLGSLLSSSFPWSASIVLFIDASFYLLGFLLYVVLITIIIYRFTFYPMQPGEFLPNYWIDMGAGAISTLAGATLCKQLPGIAGLNELLPVIKALTLFTWAVGTWWIPVVLIIEVWRHKRIPLRYSANYWSMVFPLGMYTVATFRLADVYPYSFLLLIAHAFLFLAWAAWLITFIGMCWQGKTRAVPSKPEGTINSRPIM